MGWEAPARLEERSKFLGRLLFRFFPLVVLIRLFIKVHAMLAGFIDQTKFELVKVFAAETKLAWIVLTGMHFTVNCAYWFWFTWFHVFFVSHTRSPY